MLEIRIYINGKWIERISAQNINQIKNIADYRIKRGDDEYGTLSGFNREDGAIALAAKTLNHLIEKATK